MDLSVRYRSGPVAAAGISAADLLGLPCLPVVYPLRGPFRPLLASWPSPLAIPYAVMAQPICSSVLKRAQACSSDHVNFSQRRRRDSVSKKMKGIRRLVDRHEDM